MQRLLSTALVLGLLVATAAAFAITEGLKLTLSPITRTKVPITSFSPLCNCPTSQALLKFWLRKGDVLTLDVVDTHRAEVKQLVGGVYAHAKTNQFTWNGRTDTGALAPDGSYQFKVHLARAHRTILLPNEVVLDTKPPRVLSAAVSRKTFSPDGDGQFDSVKIDYRLSKRAHAILYVRGRRLTYTRFPRRDDSLTWYGNAVSGGPALPPGTYRLELGAQDPAGNVTPARDRLSLPVRIRYIELAHRLLTAKAGTRIGVGVDTDAKSYVWRLGPSRGRSHARVLIVRVPRSPGRYRLVVEESGHLAAATVVVRPRS